MSNPDDNVIGLPDMWRKQEDDTDLVWVSWRYEFPGRALTRGERAELDAFEEECFSRNQWPEAGTEFQLKSKRRVWILQPPDMEN